LQESEYGISAIGTFRIAGEEDEHKQPMFNLTQIDCNNQQDDMGRVNVECKVTRTVLVADPDNPNAENPNCSLDLDSSSYSMKELQKGVLTGMEEMSSLCFNTILTIDRNTKRVYQSFTKTKDADHYDQIRSGTCGILPSTQVLMNCTAWPGIRANERGQNTPPRYCDFSSSSDKSQDATAGTVSSAPQHWWQGAPIVAPAPQPAPTAQRYPGPGNWLVPNR
jgi:hypothetical protein